MALDLDLRALPSTLPAVTTDPRLPAGFLVAGGSAGIKPSGRPDLAIVAGSEPMAVAAVYTTNTMPAAPVRLSQRHLAAGQADGEGSYGWAEAIVSTSGSANAATGAEGDADQARIAQALADALAIPTERTLALSTGLIGTRLPVERVEEGIRRLVSAGLASTPEALESTADALLTTDTRRKLASLETELPGPGGEGVTIRVCGFAKGVGMIHPRMATMLSVVMTDATVEPDVLHAILRSSAARTWNQLTVDGDTSTNDTVFLCASGAAGSESVASGSPAAATLGAAVEAVARSLARQQAADGEGASTLITCQASGARDDADARAVARAVVASSLVKAAVHGRDPNWGRIVAAAGNAHTPPARLLEAAGLSPGQAAARAGRPVALDPSRLRVAICGTPVFAGVPLDFDASSVAAAMAEPEVLIRVDLGDGEGTGEAFGCDLTEAYVIENSAYTT
jgi:glutamate N-acetyltransferase/amino-acid N-acetyltransferase